MCHSLPCPLPYTARTPGETLGFSGSVEPELPPSAAEAPLVAAAAGYFMLPLIPERTAGSANSLETLMLSKEVRGTTTALNTLTAAIQRVHGDEGRTVYVHVSHALSSNSPIVRLPSQPA